MYYSSKARIVDLAYRQRHFILEEKNVCKAILSYFKIMLPILIMT